MAVLEVKQDLERLEILFCDFLSEKIDGIIFPYEKW
jgi:hypothetical protein